MATHAYTVAPGYAELEQGARAFGVGGIDEGTAWDFNLKVGATTGLQLGFFGTGWSRNDRGSGMGDVGWSGKWQWGTSERQAVAVVGSVTVPTGDEREGHGAGRALGALVWVFSADLPAGWHFDFNAGPAGIGAGRPQWFTSVGLARGGKVGMAFELFDLTAGAAGPQQRGLLAAALVVVAEWAVVDAGGVARLTGESPDQLFFGVTTNLGRIFK